MTRPEDAVERARAAAAARRAEGAYADDLRGFQVEPTERVTPESLLEWALIEPDPALVYSTRRLGRPITWVKRALLRALRQYLGQIVGQQTRYNVQLALYVTALEDRVARLERLAEERRA